MGIGRTARARSRAPAARAPALLALVCALACGPASQHYRVSGVVRAVDADARQIKVEHGEIEGFMPAMTMNFDVERAELLEGVTPGARIEFSLLRTGSLLRITAIEVLDAGSAGASGPIVAGTLGAPAPAFELLDQDGRPLALESLRGSAVLLDFVFTRCPGPCPILTAAHVALQRRLPPELAPRVHFVSITIDPDHDTPERMRTYAEERGADLATWSFLSGDPERVASVLRAYHVGTRPQPDGTIDHVLVTFLIDSQGRLTHRYLGLQDHATQLLSDLEEALG